MRNSFAKTCFKLRHFAGGFLAGFLMLPASADLIFEEIGANTWRLDFDPLTFTASVNGNANFDWLIFKDFFASNATVSGGTPSETVGMSVNAAPDVQIALNNANGTFNSTLGPLTARDLLINFAQAGNKPAISSGDTITLTAPAGGFTIPITSSGVPTLPTSGTFQVGIYNNGATGTLSTNPLSVSIVPEPGSLALLIAGTGMILLRLRRNRI